MFFEMENYKHVKLRNLHAEGTSKDFAVLAVLKLLRLILFMS